MEKWIGSGAKSHLRNPELKCGLPFGYDGKRAGDEPGAASGAVLSLLSALFLPARCGTVYSISVYCPLDKIMIRCVTKLSAAISHLRNMILMGSLSPLASVCFGEILYNR